MKGAAQIAKEQGVTKRWVNQIASALGLGQPATDQAQAPRVFSAREEQQIVRELEAREKTGRGRPRGKAKSKEPPQ